MIREYDAYLQLEPWGPMRDNFHSATISSLIANSNRKPGSPPIGMERFIFRDPVEVQRERDEATIASFQRRAKRDA